MKLRARPFDNPTKLRPQAAKLFGLFIKATLGVALLVALIVWGQFDVGALSGLAKKPAAVVECIALIFLTWPLAALRWGILLRAIGVPLPILKLFHFVGIGLLFNLFLLGAVGGDAVRIFYAWRAAGKHSGRIAVTVMADRLLGLLALVTIAAIFTVLNWNRILAVPVLAALGMVVMLIFAGAVLATGLFLFAPNPVVHLTKFLVHWPRVAGALNQITSVVDLIRSDPVRLAGAFGIALLIQTITISALSLIAGAMGIGQLTAADLMFAAPLTFIANALPLTPNGLGVGEAAFDQICHWLDPTSSDAAYSSIFFAFRAISMVAAIFGIISFAIYRNEPIASDMK